MRTAMTRTMVLAGAAVFLAVTLAGWADGPDKTGTAPPVRKVQYAREILPILSANCFVCHGPDEKMRKAGLRLDIPELDVKELKSGSHAIVPGDAPNSELVARIFSKEKDRMPPATAHKQLKDTEKQLLKRWIEEGAEFQRHWAFVPPKRPTLPRPKTPGWGHNAIDAFVLARLEAEGLQPAPEADRYTLARRVSIDLTGLPPTLEAVDRFVNDKSAGAYERFVDQVLASPPYGERWAQVWLDLARYADSNGYAEDQPRTIWKFRDWVIEAINANMPFDKFTIEQIAGDLLPSPTQEQLMATGFHLNTLVNSEVGTSREVFRKIAVVDRVNTTFQVWMGVTMACAQCHNHKFDPLSQEEYFQVFAIFNQTEDNDQVDNRPNLMYLSPEHAKRKAALEANLLNLQNELKKLHPTLDAMQEKWEKETAKDQLPKNIQAILAQAAAKRNPRQKEELADYFRSTLPELKHIQPRIAKIRAELVHVQPVPTPIMKELPEAQKRATKIHLRGDFLNQGKDVKPGVPSLFQPLPEGMPPNRLALAQWLVDRRNPLTARVTVNRYWEQIF